MSCRILVEPRRKLRVNLIPHAAELGQSLVFTAGGIGGVIKWPMQTFDFARKDGALFLGGGADTDYEIGGLTGGG